jgi:DMSO/TMAO reductase YedYZ molybdopterin-dependent catalytic subunit
MPVFAQQATIQNEPRIAVTGDIATPLTLTITDLAKMPRERVEFAEESGARATYEGVALQEVLKRAGVGFGRDMRGRALSGYLLAIAQDGYEVVFGLGELDPEMGGTRIIVADKRDGSSLSANQGPIRLVVPEDKAGARSVRMLEKLQIVKLRK